jgi:acetyl esterase/lipase
MYTGVERAFLVFALFALALSVNVWRPLRRPFVVVVPSFFASWLVSELALHVIGLEVVAATAFSLHGPLGRTGLISLALTIVAAALLLESHRRAQGSGAIVKRALEEAFGLRVTPSPLRYGHLAMPFPVRHEAAVRTLNVPFADIDGVRLTLDVIRPRVPPKNAPCLVYVHGGGWVIGQRIYQGLPLMQHLAAMGWVCFSIDYRTSPRATFPDHLVDVKRGIAWVREHCAEYGGDPSFLALAGNSAGAHLAALAALTPNDPEYQPGFESVDTRVEGCLAFYGVYDFVVDRNPHWPGEGMRTLLERIVMKRKLSEAREAYEKASPVSRIHEGAPPFFVVHGTHDILAPVEESRRFVDSFRRVARAPIAYAELPLAQHAFEIFPSIRTARVLDGVAAFSEYLVQKRTGGAAS